MEVRRSGRLRRSLKKYEKDERGQYPETRIEYVRVTEKRKTRQ